MRYDRQACSLLLVIQALSSLPLRHQASVVSLQAPFAAVQPQGCLLSCSLRGGQLPSNTEQAAALRSACL